ncbi:16S rRNA (guanine(527)-N(7))-methyltransferase RsmG [Marinicrinis lubricantis]|uniref:Ribosomal RNA small subunit methyltransferase G n=1 Tax=Marinicrinis lubricantis TaxID=2086470 RepID=A0ABW1IHB1_9BACL
MTDMIQQQFVGWLHEKGLDVSAEQLEQFELYYRILVEWNEKMNLTGITERAEVYEKHFFDSLTPAFEMDFTGEMKVIDIGSGAGFPGIPLKIMFPQLSLTILDSLNKRIQFLHHVVSELRLTDVQCVHGRAEEYGRNIAFRDRYDVAFARAVARLSVLNEFCLPFVREGGTFISMKGSQADEEISEAEFSIKVLGAKLDRTITLTLPIEKSVRSIILIRKVKGTPGKYPRKPGLPLKQPLTAK